MKRIPIERALALLLILCAFVSSGEDAKAKFKYFKEIECRNVKADIFRARLDSEIYDAAGASLDDIRIIDASGREVPFILRVDDSVETKNETQYNTVKISSLKKLDSNELELILEAPGKLGEVCGLEIRTPSKNFEKNLSLEASENLSDWKMICSGSIFDYSDFADLSNLKIKFPLRKESKYYRVRIANFAEGRKSPRSELISEKRAGSDFSVIEKIVFSEEPLKIEAVGLLTQFECVVKQVNKSVQYPVKDFQVKELPGRTEISFSTKMEPLEKAVIRTSSANFARECRVSVSYDGRQWREQPGSAGKISSIDLSGYKDSNLSLSLSGRNKHYMITILNGDSPPLKISGLDIFGSVHILEFISNEDLSRNGAKVYYGGDAVSAPSYDTKEIMGRLKNPSAADVILGAGHPNPEYSGDFGGRKFLNSRNVFFAAIGIMLAILSWVLLRSFRKIESMPAE